MKTSVSSKSLTLTSSCWTISPTACFNKDSFISICLPFQKLGQVEIKTSLCTVKKWYFWNALMLYCVLAKLYRTFVKECRPWMTLLLFQLFLSQWPPHRLQEMDREIMNLSKDQRFKIAWREKQQDVYNMNVWSMQFSYGLGNNTPCVKNQQNLFLVYLMLYQSRQVITTSY